MGVGGGRERKTTNTAEATLCLLCPGLLTQPLQTTGLSWRSTRGRSSDSGESAASGRHQVGLIRGLNPALTRFLIFCGRRQDPTLATKVMVIKNQAFGSKTTDRVKPTASPLKQHGTDASKLEFFPQKAIRHREKLFPFCSVTHMIGSRKKIFKQKKKIKYIY